MNHRLRTFATALFDQQMWLFGQDIRYPDGNLLLQVGFEKFVCPEHLKRGNMYRLCSDCGVQVWLWGFGILYRNKDQGSIFLKRFDFRPKYLANLNLEQPVFGSEFLSRDSEANVRVLCSSIKWIESYEASIVNITGKYWRHQCINGWKAKAMTYDTMSSGWKMLRKRLKHYEKRHTS